jgi:hypothetical protein
VGYYELSFQTWIAKGAGSIDALLPPSVVSKLNLLAVRSVTGGGDTSEDPGSIDTAGDIGDVGTFVLCKTLGIDKRYAAFCIEALERLVRKEPLRPSPRMRFLGFGYRE